MKVAQHSKLSKKCCQSQLTEEMYLQGKDSAGVKPKSAIIMVHHRVNGSATATEVMRGRQRCWGKLSVNHSNVALVGKSVQG